MDAGGKYSGTVSGMMNMAGNFGGAMSPLVFGNLGAVRQCWQAPFVVAAVLLVIGAGSGRSGSIQIAPVSRRRKCTGPPPLPHDNGLDQC